jgi:hypothetical protein
MHRSILQILLALTFALGCASAADAPPVQDWSPETVVVVGHRAGPIFWRVHRGNGDVYILAVVGPIPEDLTWDHASLDHVLDGAKAVLLQPHAEVGIFEGAWFLLTERSSFELKNDAHLEDVLDPALKQRFVQAREKLHRDADRYEDLLPAWAALRLFGDFLGAENFTADEPTDTVKHLAGRKDIPVHPVATYEALPVVRDVGKMSDADSRICLRNALDDIQAEEAHQAAAARAWAVGDLAGMKANYSEVTILGCLQAVPKFATLWARSVDDVTKAVDAALDGGGKTVMVASLGELLRHDGILDRLRAQGATIEAPE